MSTTVHYRDGTTGTYDEVTSAKPRLRFDEAVEMEHEKKGGLKTWPYSTRRASPWSKSCRTGSLSRSSSGWRNDFDEQRRARDPADSHGARSPSFEPSKHADNGSHQVAADQEPSGERVHPMTWISGPAVWIGGIVAAAFAAAFAAWIMLFLQFLPPPQQVWLRIANASKARPPLSETRFRLVLCWLENDRSGRDTGTVGGGIYGY